MRFLSGRVEESDEADLLRQSIRQLDHTEAGQVFVLWEERNRVIEDDLSARAGDLDDGRVPIAEEVHIGATDSQRLVDLDGRRVWLAVAHLCRDVGAVVSGLSEGVCVLLFVLRRELMVRAESR